MSSGITPPRLHLSVQYASTRPSPPRDRVRRWTRAALDGLAGSRTLATTCSLTVRFVDDDEGRALNKSFRGKDYATNVLTFPYPDFAGALEADIVVCLPVVEREAHEQHKDAIAHCAHLVVHGVLHAAGLDHETAKEAATMEALERTVLTRFAITDPYREASARVQRAKRHPSAARSDVR